MITCQECRYFTFATGVPIGGSTAIGLCRLGSFLICAEEKACESRPMRAGEIAQLRHGGFALVAEDQAPYTPEVTLRGLHSLRLAHRADLTSINPPEDNT